MNNSYYIHQLINDLELKTGIEIGVRDGGNMVLLLDHTKLEKLYGLDLGVIKNAGSLQNRYPDRAILITGNSHEYFVNFEDSYFDFIYVDAGHSYEDCKKDLDCWYPKLRSGGVFAGDDYENIMINPETKNPQYGVVDAVNDFVFQHNLDFEISNCDDQSLEGKIKEAYASGKRTQRQGFCLDRKDITRWWLIKP